MTGTDGLQAHTMTLWRLLARYHTDPADLWQSSPALQKEVETIAWAARAFLESDRLKTSLADLWYDDGLEADIQPLLDLCRTSPNRLWNHCAVHSTNIRQLFMVHKGSCRIYYRR